MAALDLSGGNDTLRREVKVAVTLSRFKPECRGQSVRIVFAFTLEAPVSYEIRPPAVRYVPPDRFELTFKRAKAVIEPPTRDLPPPGR